VLGWCIIIVSRAGSFHLLHASDFRFCAHPLQIARPWKVLKLKNNFKGAWKVFEHTKFVTSTWNALENHSWDCAAAHNMINMRFILPQQPRSIASSKETNATCNLNFSWFHVFLTLTGEHRLQNENRYYFYLLFPFKYKTPKQFQQIIRYVWS
jgi:hypothetical protein